MSGGSLTPASELHAYIRGWETHSLAGDLLGDKGEVILILRSSEASDCDWEVAYMYASVEFVFKTGMVYSSCLKGCSKKELLQSIT